MDKIEAHDLLLVGGPIYSDNMHYNVLDLIKQLPELKKECPWLKEVNSQTLQFAIRSLEVAYTNFFQKRAKFPNFKSKHSKNSFTVPQFASVAGGRLFIPKFKEGIKCRVHRERKGEIGKVTIS